MSALTSRLLSLLFVCLAFTARADTLATIKASGHLDCATVQNIDDWAHENLHGDLSALGAEICRAVATAILGDDKGLAIQAFPGEAEAVNALASGKVQLAVGLSPVAGVAARYGLAYARPVFYDSQRFLVHKQSGLTGLTGLRDQVICAIDMTDPERTLRDEMTARGIPYSLQAHSEQGEMDAAVAVTRCVGTALESRLAQSRADFHARVSDFVFLPERLTLDPVAPAYLAKDADLGKLVDWTIGALIEAEALGVTRDNVESARKREDLRAIRLLGGDFATAQAFGLAHDWVAKVVAATGNYGEIFQRTVGGPYRLERGLNALWRDGGLMAPPPMQ
jgi:general L-amino acid transport system substrate-binding protein